MSELERKKLEEKQAFDIDAEIRKGSSNKNELYKRFNKSN